MAQCALMCSTVCKQCSVCVNNNNALILYKGEMYIVTRGSYVYVLYTKPSYKDAEFTLEQ